MVAISLESEQERKYPAGQFQTFTDIQQSTSQEVKDYFKTFMECIHLEQGAEMNYLDK